MTITGCLFKIFLISFRTGTILSAIFSKQAGTLNKKKTHDCQITFKHIQNIKNKQFDLDLQKSSLEVINFRCIFLQWFLKVS